MGVKQKKGSKSKKTSKVGKIKSAVGGMISGSKGRSSGSGRRKKGPAYWQNKVLVEKLKRRYNKLKFGGR